MDESAPRDIAKLDCGPVVFDLWERAYSNNVIFVVVEGSICVQEGSRGNGSLETMGFGTKVGYFRFKHDRLEHVYGVHYDMDERGEGHPVFHAQLGPAKNMASAIHDQFHLDTKLCDHVGPILRNVRTPTAQMDFFSVFTQLCADHLMSIGQTDSDPQVAVAFDRVRSACRFLQGAAHRLTYLNSGIAPNCYRSSHWYGGV